MAAGYTQAHFDSVSLSSSTAPFNQLYTLPSQTYGGWFLGTGFEYGVTWMPGLFWKSEYRFSDYSKERIVLQPADFAIDSRKYVHQVRTELVWRFSFGGPVVARY